MDRSPLLVWAWFFLLGCSVVVAFHWVYAISLVALLVFFRWKWFGIALFVMGWSWTSFRYPDYGAELLEGKGTFILQSIQPAQSPFQKSYAIRGKFSDFETADGIYFNLPCVIFQKNPPPKGKRFEVSGKLEEGMFKCKAKTSWKTIDPSFSWGQFRFENKQRVRNYFQNRFSDPRVNHFFGSMVTGDIDDRLLAMEFRKVGLGHILGISGFHFALFAGMLGGFFSLFFRQKLTHALLLTSLCLYFVFLGFTPPIFRGFVMISLYLVGRMLHRKIDVPNLLGAAILLELVINPLILTDVGFQLSFLATFGLLTYLQDFEKWLQKWFPKRSFFEAKRLSRLGQHGYLLSNLLRQELSLSAAVQLVTFPVVLYTFKAFPLLTIPYNLLFIPLLGISLLILPMGVILPPIGWVNAKYTSFLLKLIANPPEIINYKIASQGFSFPQLVLFLTVIGILGLTRCRKQG